jgi:hypothetical protein
MMPSAIPVIEKLFKCQLLQSLISNVKTYRFFYPPALKVVYPITPDIHFLN